MGLCSFAAARTILSTAGIVLVLSAFSSCEDGMGEDALRRKVDSLNALSYSQHYRSLDSTAHYARRALAMAAGSKYADGRDEALCNLAFVQTLRMDYDSATTLYRQVTDRSHNELLKLLADVGMMKVCQRRSNNRELYDFRSAAEKRMARIRPEADAMTDHQRLLWNYAQSDYHMTLSIYYYYLRQEDQAVEELTELTRRLDLQDCDTAQLAMFYFLSGNARNVDNMLTEDNLDNILKAVALSHQDGYTYILSKSLTTLATDLIHAVRMRSSHMAFMREILSMPDSAPDSEMSLRLSQRALADFKDYGSLFDISQTYIAIADYYLYAKQYETALDTLAKALDCINEHHRMASRADGGETLRPFNPRAAELSIEMQWISNPASNSLPEWMADVRERLCLVYSALGKKRESDYNRNIYLDILDATRQDRLMEQRLSSVKAEEATVNRTILFAAATIVLLALLVFYMSRRLRSNYAAYYRREQEAVEEEMGRWRTRADQSFSSLEEQQDEVKAERSANERRLAEQKRRYIDKTTCLSIVYAITPFLDRALNEVAKLRRNGRPSDAADRDRLLYLGELIDRINLYNDVLAHWIKIRQGAVSLNIENFALQPLFDILSKSTNIFRNKRLALRVETTPSVVKADKALTLFMANTLLENARKYTREGGSVTLRATEAGSYVEISVADTGRGLSPEDVACICDEKVYDSSKIGHPDADSELQRNKGFGFGLMNCKGIIEKYRKTSPLFAVCTLGIESQLGKGSRFFFRLPKGTIRTLALALLLAIGNVPALARAINTAHRPDSLRPTATAQPSNPMIEKASAHADSAYFDNVDGYYANALAHVDSACHWLNRHYLSKHPGGQLLMRLIDKRMPEIELWKQGFATDYAVILDIRNEAAIAALALNRWDVYYYNNEVYTRLYKLNSQDTTLVQYCNSIQTATTNKRTVLVVLVAVILLGLAIYYLIYYRSNILTTFNMRQILELNRRIFNNDCEDALPAIILAGVTDIRRTDGVALMYADRRTLSSASCPQPGLVHDTLARCMDRAAPEVGMDGRLRAFPLEVEGAGVIGAIAFVFHSGNIQPDDDRLFQLTAQYTAVNIYFSNIRMERLRRDIELQEDEKRRAEREENAVHVQNMVLDNCLSTIKHETMYYPNRIKTIVDRLLGRSGGDTRAQIDSIGELITYYKEVFTLLSACAARQLAAAPFKRQPVPLAAAAAYAETAFRRQRKKAAAALDLTVVLAPAAAAARAIADETMLRYLMECVLAAAADLMPEGRLRLDIATEAHFAKFALTLEGLRLDDETIHNLFYAHSLRYDPDTDTLHGAQFLVARQIVREHDEHVRRGCRIYAAPAEAAGATGTQIAFTIPLK